MTEASPDPSAATGQHINGHGDEATGRLQEIGGVFAGADQPCILSSPKAMALVFGHRVTRLLECASGHTYSLGLEGAVAARSGFGIR